MFIRLFNIIGKFFSSSHAHDKALYWSKLKDPNILAKAGMFITAMNNAHCPIPLTLKSLLLTGEIKSFWNLVHTHPDAFDAANLYGMLASMYPERTATLPDLPLFIQEYCAIELGSVKKVKSDNVYLRWMSAAKKDDLNKVNECLAEIFVSQKLQPPHLLRGSKGLHVRCVTHLTKKIPVSHKPQLSIIMTAFDEESRIGMAIDSLIVQTWNDFELLVVDDHSSDGTSAIIKEKAEQDIRVKPLFLPTNVGTFGAKNIALDHAKGKYVMMHDADDWSHPERLRLMMSSLDTPNITAVSSRYIRVDEISGCPVSDDVRNFCRWNPSSFLCKRDFFKRHGGYLQILGSDCEMVARHEMLYGVACHKRLPLVLSIGLSKRQSLSRRYKGVNGGRRRVEDWETWRRMHVDYLAKHKELLWKP